MRIFLLALLIGCGGGSGDEQIVESAGRMCLHASPPNGFGNPEPQSFVAGSPITVRVELNACLSSSCDINREMSCAVNASGNDIGVTSIATWTDTSASSNGCTDDCGILATTCTIEGLAAGTYTVVFGNKTIELTVPSETTEQPCVEADVGGEG